MKTIMTIMIIVGILAVLFMLLSGFLIVCIAWTHKQVSVRQMLKGYIEELRGRSANEG